MDVRDYLQRAIDEFGNESALAKAAGVSQGGISDAKKRNSVGWKLAQRIDRATAGRVSKSDLCPHIWPRDERAEGASPTAT